MFARLNTSRNRNFLLELLMIVVGINIALWFEGWFEDLRDAETEQQYLEGLRDDLLIDLQQLDSAIELNTARLELIGDILPGLPTLSQSSSDNIARAMFAPSSYHFFEPSDFTYRSMQESGDFRLLGDSHTKKLLLKLVQQYQFIETLQDNFIQAMDDGYIPLMMSGFDLIERRVTDAGLLGDQAFRNFFAYTYQDVETRLYMYKLGRDQVQELLEVIEAQIRN